MGFFSRLFSKTEKISTVGPQRNNVVCDYYSVKGVNPDTNRRKSKIIVVDSTSTEEEIQEKSGLLPPYEIEKLNQEAPTDRQIAYAEKLGIVFPADASVSDASVFLTRHEDGVPLVQPPAPDTLVRYLIGKGIFVPAYAGISEVSGLYLNNVSRNEKAAFFCMRVFCSIKNKSYCLLEDVPLAERNLFFEFANAYEADGDFLRSLLHYTAEDLPLNACPRLKKLKAYEMAVDFLKNRGFA